MPETHTFLMPDYYPDFLCKMGNCRSACCEGWPVSVTMENYFLLIGTDCSPDLRRRLDCALRPARYPNRERYAVISPRWDGNCPLRADDGRCALQLELGEEVLADVCRLYPRGIRNENGEYECSCSNSCEAVLELLLSHKGPLRFIRRTMTTLIPGSAKRNVCFNTFGHEWDLRKRYFDILSDPAQTLPERLSVLGEVLAQTDNALREKTPEAITALLSRPLPSPVSAPPETLTERLSFGLKAAESLLGLLDGYSTGIRDWGERAIAYFRSSPDGELAAYRRADAQFSAVMPEWEDFFSKMLVNYLFFVRFPFQDRPETAVEEFAALCCVYGLLRFLSLGCVFSDSAYSTPEMKKASPDARVREIDLCASAFRLFAHTDFDADALRLMRSLDVITQDALTDFISL